MQREKVLEICYTFVFIVNNTLCTLKFLLRVDLTLSVHNKKKKKKGLSYLSKLGRVLKVDPKLQRVNEWIQMKMKEASEKF